MRLAERQRVQGSVFKIEGVPLLVFKYARRCLGILPINDGSQGAYTQLKHAIESKPPTRFWSALPANGRNWLIVFDLEEAPNEMYIPDLLTSRSVGGLYRLQWARSDWFRRREIERPQFKAFSEWLMKRVQKRRSRPRKKPS